MGWREIAKIVRAGHLLCDGGRHEGTKKNIMRRNASERLLWPPGPLRKQKAEKRPALLSTCASSIECQVVTDVISQTNSLNSEFEHETRNWEIRRIFLRIDSICTIEKFSLMVNING